MGTLDLTALGPNGTANDVNPVNGNFAAVKNLVEGNLDNSNIEKGSLNPDRLNGQGPDGMAENGNLLVWNDDTQEWEPHRSYVQAQRTWFPITTGTGSYPEADLTGDNIEFSANMNRIISAPIPFNLSVQSDVMISYQVMIKVWTDGGTTICTCYPQAKIDEGEDPNWSQNGLPLQRNPGASTTPEYYMLGMTAWFYNIPPGDHNASAWLQQNNAPFKMATQGQSPVTISARAHDPWTPIPDAVEFEQPYPADGPPAELIAD